MIQIDLAGKVALVTGASGQLGRVIARRLAECGAAVAVHYSANKTQADLCVERIIAAGGKAIAVQADVSDYDSVVHMREVVTEAIGAPDIIVNAAVAQYTWTTVLEQNLEDYESQYKTCVLQNVIMAKVFVPAMQEKKWGRVIAINTECAMQNFPTQSAYVSGKRGMDGVLRVLAKEVGKDGITVNQVAPGWTISDNDRIRHTERHEGYESAVPLRRRGEDTEIANAVVFFASELSSYVTGTYLPVCGGNVMPCI